MITLSILELKNFLSHEDTLIQFKKDEKLLIDGVSGSGKSSIVDAIIWALYGVGRVDNKSLIRVGTETAQVTLTLDNEGVAYMVCRSINKAGKHILLVMQDGKPVPTAGTKETQKWIEEKLLHCSYELFVNSVAYPQNSQDSFVLASNVRRKELLLEIIGVNDIDEYHERTRALLSIKEKEEIERSTELAVLSGQIDSLKKQTELLPGLISELALADDDETEYNKLCIESLESLTKIKEEEKELVDLESVLRKNESDIGAVVANSHSVKSNIVENLRPLEAVQKEIDELLPKEEEFKKITEELNGAVIKNHERNAMLAERPSAQNFSEKIEFLSSRLKKLESEQPDCPSGPECPYMARVAPEKASLVEDIAEAKKNKEGYDAILAEWEEKFSELGDDPTMEINSRLSLLRQPMEKLKNLRTEITTAKAREEKNDIYRTRLIEIDATFQSLVEERTVFQTKIAALQEKKLTEKRVIAEDFHNSMVEKRNKANAQVSNLKVSIAVALHAAEELDNKTTRIGELSGLSNSAEIEQLKLLKDAFGSSGIKALAVDYMIPRLEDKINEVLSQMSDFRVQLDTQKKSQSDTTVEGLFITIRNELGETFDFSSYSGGEKLKITVAISEALASLQKVGFRILDELFVGLDEDSTESFALVLSQVQSRFSQMICISHLRSIKDLFESHITVVKHNGISLVS